MDNGFTYSMLEPIIREKLENGATVTIQPKGTSMLPLIRQGQDEVILKKPSGRLNKYDIPFYKRASGQFVLHRIVKRRKNDYVLCGDNQIDYEYGITDDMIIAVIEAIKKDGKIIPVTDKEYLKYSKNHLLKIKKKRVISRIKRVIKFVLRYKK